jgi:hypothetical protein
MYLFFPRKGAEAPDLNAQKLSEARGFSGQFHIKSMFLGKKKVHLWPGSVENPFNSTFGNFKPISGL